MKVYCIVTLYKVTIKRVEEIINKLTVQFDEVLLVDNTPNVVLKLKSMPDNCIYLANKENLGLGKALNRGAELALDKGADYLVFLDQDTNLPNDYKEKMVKSYFELINSGVEIGCIGPIYYDLSSRKQEIPRRKTRINEKNYQVESIITSGMFISKNIFKRNRLSEKIFLDYVDWEYCWRLAFQGKKVILNKEVIIEHSLGIGIKKIGFLSIRIGQPFRVFYQVRDSIYLIFSETTPAIPRIRFLINLLIRPWIYLIFLDNKKERLLFYFKGVFSALKRNTGEIK